MATLTLKYENKVLKEQEISRYTSLTIGRREGNDIVIDNLGVSGHHAKIDPVGDRFLLTDLKSKNGTFVNERLITSHWLKDGDVIVIGKHALVFACEESKGCTANELRPMDVEQTMVLETDMHQAMLARSFERTATSEIERETVGALVYLSGGEGEVKLTKKLTKIGKDPLCDIAVNGLMVGKTAVTISNRPAGYFLSYVGGMAKPKVNGQTVKESVKLEEFDTIEIGSAKMQFIHQFVYKK